MGTAFVGEYDTRDQNRGQVRRVIEATLHPDYVGTSNNDDLAIMKLERPIVNPTLVNLNTDSEIPPQTGEELLMLGWGSITDGQTAPVQVASVLQEAPTQFIPFAQCAVARDPLLGIEFGFSVEETGVPPGWLCTYDENFAHCVGDSGGPVLRLGATAEEDLLIGVISA